MTVPPFEGPETTALVLPEAYKNLELFSDDQAVVIAESHQGNIDILDIPGVVGQRLRRIGQNPRDGGDNYTATWWLSRVYTPKADQFDIDVDFQVAEMPMVVKQKLHDVSAHLADPSSGYYFVGVDTFVEPESQGGKSIHQLARLHDVGITDDRKLFSVLEGRDGQLGYRPLKPVEGRAVSALYR